MYSCHAPLCFHPPQRTARPSTQPGQAGQAIQQSTHTGAGSPPTQPISPAVLRHPTNHRHSKPCLLAFLQRSKRGEQKKSTVRSATLSRPRFQLPLQRPVPRPTSNYWPSVAFPAVAATARLGPFPVAWQVCAMCLGEGEVVCTWSHATGGQPFQAGEQLKAQGNNPAQRQGKFAIRLPSPRSVAGRGRWGSSRVADRLGSWW
jgi:hypothetical protein